ncbi:putative capsid protein [Magnaporthe oryzae partitivirus 1]|nr:putative capsid protein [Magnaporthe oryzae partitivirus 1]UVX28890.1 MAG: putative coat protein [Magnaporthe oryzae partitivirus 1-A]
MSDSQGQTDSKAPIKPGDNPNKLNARPRQGARPRTKNQPAGGSSNSMRLNWIDPLPQVDVIHPLGLEPNPEVIPAGEIDLDFFLPETISTPFVDTIDSIGDRIQMSDEDKEVCKDRLKSLAFFKAARQLYSTMLDHEKAVNQPLKAVYYDETPIPLHMAGALGIIGHMDTKVGKVMIRDPGLLFKRWIAQGLKIENNDRYPGDPSKKIWIDAEGLRHVKRLARERIDYLVKQTYTVTRDDGVEFTVSMPQLTDQALPDYYGFIRNEVPGADDLRHCVAALEMTLRQWRDDTIPHGIPRHDIHQTLDLQEATGNYSLSNMREWFEDFIAGYVTDVKWRLESIFKVGPPPAGTTGYGAQTVEASGNTARWKFPLSDADVNIGYLFSPNKYFNLAPRLVGYSRRDRSSQQAAFAQADGKAFVN